MRKKINWLGIEIEKNVREWKNKIKKKKKEETTTIKKKAKKKKTLYCNYKKHLF